MDAQKALAKISQHYTFAAVPLLHLLAKFTSMGVPRSPLVYADVRIRAPICAGFYDGRFDASMAVNAKQLLPFEFSRQVQQRPVPKLAGVFREANMLPTC